MRGEIEAIRASKRKAKAQRDNWKARYVALEAALRDDALAYRAALQSGRDCALYERRMAIGNYRARLLAKIDDRETT